jgi:hypothetical protein
VPFSLRQATSLRHALRTVMANRPMLKKETFS